MFCLRAQKRLCTLSRSGILFTPRLKICSKALQPLVASPKRPVFKGHSRTFSQSSLLNATTQFKSASLNSDDRHLEVLWSDDSKSKYPYVWLRDNCQCNECFHPVSLSRTLGIADFDLNSAPVQLQIHEDTVKLTWDNGHESIYSDSWLRDRSFTPEHVRTSKPPPQFRLRLYWGSELVKGFPTASFPSIVESDEALLDWLCDLHAYGLVRISDAPKEKGCLRKIAERISFPRKTHYGEEFFIASKGDPSNVAYTSGTLPLHTDLPYYVYKPGAELLHCLVQQKQEGGESMFVDAFNAALQLKKINPEAYKLLSTIDIDWVDIGTEDGLSFHSLSNMPVICTSSSGTLTRINFSLPQRDSYFRVSYDIVEPWYRALKAFYEVLTDPRNVLTFKMNEGDIYSFDNLRILHGRTEFSGLSERLIEGIYVDWDEIYSKIRVTETKHKVKQHAA